MKKKRAEEKIGARFDTKSHEASNKITSKDGTIR